MREQLSSGQDLTEQVGKEAGWSWMRELRSVPWHQLGTPRPALLMKSSSPYLAAQVLNVRGLLNMRIAFKVTPILR